MKRQRRAKNLTFGDLIDAMCSSTPCPREALLAIADILGSGRARLLHHGRKVRAVVDFKPA